MGKVTVNLQTLTSVTSTQEARNKEFAKAKSFFEQNRLDRTAELRAVPNKDGTFTLYTCKDNAATRLRNLLRPDAVQREREAARVCVGVMVERKFGYEVAKSLFERVDGKHAVL